MNDCKFQQRIETFKEHSVYEADLNATEKLKGMTVYKL